MRGSESNRQSLRASTNALRRAVKLYALNHSPRAFIQAFFFLVRKVKGRHPPFNAFIAVTNRCQCRCPHCYTPVDNRSNQKELTTREILSVLDQLRAMGTLQAVFTGGEPLLRPDIFELIAYAHTIGLLTRMNTNAYKLDRACASKLREAGLDQCGISIDYVEPEPHDRFRSLEGIHARALQAFGYLRENHIQRRMYVSVTHAKLVAGLGRFVEFSKELKVNSCFFAIPYAVGRWEGSYEKVLSEEEMVTLRRLQKHSSVVMEFSTPRTNCCVYDKTLININAMGDVSPCPAVPFTLGNIRKEALAAIWNRHVSAVIQESRGKCPINIPQGRDQMRAYCASVSGIPQSH